MKKDQSHMREAAYLKDLRRIWAMARELGLDSDAVHLLLITLCGKDSLKKTSRAERWKLISELQSKLRAVQEKPQGRRGTDLISDRQQRKIEELWAELEKLEPNAASYPWRQAFAYRIIQKNWPQKIWEAQALIEALKKRIQQGAEHKSI